MIHKLLQHLAWFFLKILISTYRFETVGDEHREAGTKLHPEGGQLIACWHEHMIAFLSAHAHAFPYLAMASRSRDGDYAAFLTKKMGFTPVRGSSRKRGKDKGGKEALELYIQEISRGGRGGITIDGPRGPRHVCKPGIVQIAEKTGAAIVPGTSLAKHYYAFNSWDKFKLPLPFTRIRLAYGEPIIIPKGSSQTEIAVFCRLVEEKIEELEERVKW